MILLGCMAALAGELDGQVSLDLLSATSKAEGAGIGPSENLSAHELGMRLRVRLRELDNRLQVKINYQGREPIAGTYPNTARRLLYEAQVSYQLVPERLTVGFGRFAAPAPTFLLVDGLNVRYSTKAITVGLFGGRRGVSTSLVTLGIKDWLPAFGGWFQLHLDKVQAQATVLYQQDRVRVASAGNGRFYDGDVGGLQAQVRASAQPIDALDVGASASFIQAATYRLGPTWAEADIEATAFGLFNVWGWANFHPAKWLRVELDGGHQAMQSYRVGSVDGDGAQDDDVVGQPQFTDLRLGLRAGPPKYLWVRPMARFRVRPSGIGPSPGTRTELRAGLQLDVHHIGIPGPYFRGALAFDDIGGQDQKDDIGLFDRTYGRAALGFRKAGFDGSLGASYVQRAALPVSGRRVSAANTQIPDSSEDLQPFTLEADPILFARMFYGGKRFFGGADLEKNLTESEFRVFLQLGVLAGVGW